MSACSALLVSILFAGLLHPTNSLSHGALLLRPPTTGVPLISTVGMEACVSTVGMEACVASVAANVVAASVANIVGARPKRRTSSREQRAVKPRGQRPRARGESEEGNFAMAALLLAVPTVLTLPADGRPDSALKPRVLGEHEAATKALIGGLALLGGCVIGAAGLFVYTRGASAPASRAAGGVQMQPPKKKGGPVLFCSVLVRSVPSAVLRKRALLALSANLCSHIRSFVGFLSVR